MANTKKTGKKTGRVSGGSGFGHKDPDVLEMVPLLVVKVGSDDRPAWAEDMESMAVAVEEAVNGSGVLVTHHAVEFTTVYVPKGVGGVKVVYGRVSGEDGVPGTDPSEDPSVAVEGGTAWEIVSDDEKWNVVRRKKRK